MGPQLNSPGLEVDFLKDIPSLSSRGGSSDDGLSVMLMVGLWPYALDQKCSTDLLQKFSMSEKLFQCSRDKKIEMVGGCPHFLYP